MSGPMSRSQEAGQGESSAGDTAVTAGTVTTAEKKFPHLMRALTRRFPFPSRPALFPLPSSYTQLHSQLTAMGGYSFPALCLLCGAVLDANGRGKCATHSMICNKDAGVIFLLQVSHRQLCSILSYFIYHHALYLLSFPVSFLYPSMINYCPIPPHTYSLILTFICPSSLAPSLSSALRSIPPGLHGTALDRSKVLLLPHPLRG